ncbi:hypothetical protein HPB51_008570 [Rhipicephalus microplus]|uniref:Uncharacterized protein n=1 Tax=Rhipicephalus microplus TaxID=6941 RepID=A0A9J6EGU5_RHIMP|nr:hypothetical protein HPB51_008570 [Rhipicephalus microplus]
MSASCCLRLLLKMTDQRCPDHKFYKCSPQLGSWPQPGDESWFFLLTRFGPGCFKWDAEAQCLWDSPAHFKELQRCRKHCHRESFHFTQYHARFAQFFRVLFILSQSASGAALSGVGDTATSIPELYAVGGVTLFVVLRPAKASLPPLDRRLRLQGVP